MSLLAAQSNNYQMPIVSESPSVHRTTDSMVAMNGGFKDYDGHLVDNLVDHLIDNLLTILFTLLSTISLTILLTVLFPVLEIDYRGYRGRRTKDIWEDQKAGRPKNLVGECPNICLQL